MNKDTENMFIKESNISYWNKWDLHIHSPYSYDYSEKYKNKLSDDEINNWIDKLLKILVDKEIKLFSITDHSMFGWVKINWTTIM